MFAAVGRRMPGRRAEDRIDEQRAAASHHKGLTGSGVGAGDRDARHAPRDGGAERKVQRVRPIDEQAAP